MMHEAEHDFVFHLSQLKMYALRGEDQHGAIPSNNVANVICQLNYARVVM